MPYLARPARDAARRRRPASQVSGRNWSLVGCVADYPRSFGGHDRGGTGAFGAARPGDLDGSPGTAPDARARVGTPAGAVPAPEWVRRVGGDPRHPAMAISWCREMDVGRHSRLELAARWIQAKLDGLRRDQARQLAYVRRAEWLTTQPGSCVVAGSNQGRYHLLHDSRGDGEPDAGRRPFSESFG
jgi:hypothetical protein